MNDFGFQIADWGIKMEQLKKLIEKHKELGERIKEEAERTFKPKSIIIFDRRGRTYHGRVRFVRCHQGRPEIRVKNLTTGKEVFVPMMQNPRSAQNVR